MIIIYLNRAIQSNSKNPNFRFLILNLTSNQPSEFQNAKGEESFEDTEARPEEDIDDVMPAESDSRNDGDHGPSPNTRDEQINGQKFLPGDGDTWQVEMVFDQGAREGEDRGDKADSGGMAAGEREVVNGDDGVVLGVVGVGGAGAADEEFDYGDEEKVEEGAEDEREEEVGAERGGGGCGQIQREGHRKEETEIGDEFEKTEERSRRDGAGEGVDVVGDGVVDVVDAPE